MLKLAIKFFALFQGIEEVPYELSTDESKSQSTVSAVDLEQQSQQLQNQLLQLQLEKQLGLETVEGLSQPHLTAHKRLAALIDAVKQIKVWLRVLVIAQYLFSWGRI